MRSGRLPTHSGDMSDLQLDVRRARRLTGSAWWAVATGVSGIVANVLLVIFFALSAPYGLALPAFAWSGSANDVAVAIQFATFIPVGVGLARYLPDTQLISVATVVGVVAMTCVAGLQALLVANLLSFDEMRLVIPAMAVVFGWLVVVSSAGHRHRCLPRMVTRSGLLLGATFLVGMVLFGSAALMSQALVGRVALLVPGIVLGAIGWFGLPVWPLLLARRVFAPPGKPSEITSGTNKGGAS